MCVCVSVCVCILPAEDNAIKSALCVCTRLCVQIMKSLFLWFSVCVGQQLAPVGRQASTQGMVTGAYTGLGMVTHTHTHTHARAHEDTHASGSSTRT